MKHNNIYILAAFMMLFCTAIPALYADEICDISLQEGKTAYNAGNYQKAKELFEYVKSECGRESKYSDIQDWIDKCNEALTPTTLSVSSASLSFDANGGNQTITVTCNREWSLANTSSDMFTVTRYGNQLTISCITNNSTNSRNGYFDIKSNDGKKSQHISISQLGRQTSSQNNNKNSTQTTSSSSNSRSSSNSGTTNTTTNSTNDPYSPISLNLSETSIICGPEGVQRKKIKVYCNRDWSFNKGDENGNYYAYKTDNNKSLVVTVAENKTDRYVYGSIKVYCGAKEATISISQAPKTSGRNNDKNRSNYSSSYTRKPAYKKYIEWSGLWEVTWIGVSAGVGYGFNITGSTLRCRLGPVEIRPIDLAIIYYNFSTGLNISYQPIVDFYIPVSYDKAIYFGAGPSIELVENNLWLKIEAGFHWNWGGTHASSDFFARYDGAFLVGVSIQCSSHY